MTARRTDKRGRTRLLVYVEPELDQALRTWAREEERSLSGQARFVLREAVRGRGQPAESVEVHA